jgi:hypothetical protein
VTVGAVVADVKDDEFSLNSSVIKVVTASIKANAVATIATFIFFCIASPLRVVIAPQVFRFTVNPYTSTHCVAHSLNMQ